MYLHRPRLLRALQEGLPEGVLVHAPAGFGKTLLLKSFAEAKGLPYRRDWSPEPGWKVWVGYPRTGVSWEPSQALKAEFVAEADFGSFYVTEDPRTPRPGQVRLDRTRLEYRAVRVGPAIT